MKKYLFAVIFFLAFTGIIGKPVLQEVKYSHYDVKLKIIPEKQFIKVTGTLKYLVKQDSINELTFNLHKKFVIKKFIVNGDNSFKFDTSVVGVRWLPDAAKIFYSAKRKFHKGEILDVEFEYEGNIKDWPEWSANVVTPGWVEMGYYFPWYPSIYDMFTYKVEVDISPGYNVFAIGKSIKENNKEVFETDFPVDDFIICASKDLTVKETKLLGHSFKIVNSRLSNATVNSIQKDVEDIYNLYSDWFGKINVRDMCLVISKRNKGGGYSRRGGLFLGGLSDSSYRNDRTDFIQYLSHEIAHFWWHSAAGNWEDWLNEGFSEYSSMKLIKELCGEKEFNAKMKVKEDEIVNTPPVWGIDRNDQYAQQVLYSKSVVLLYKLAERIGENKFLELCKARIEKKVNNTADLLVLLKNIAGKENADWFEESLKTK